MFIFEIEMLGGQERKHAELKRKLLGLSER
jgi:hypothetical protein